MLQFTHCRKKQKTTKGVCNTEIQTYTTGGNKRNEMKKDFCALRRKSSVQEEKELFSFSLGVVFPPCLAFSVFSEGGLQLRCVCVQCSSWQVRNIMAGWRRKSGKGEWKGGSAMSHLKEEVGKM